MAESTDTSAVMDTSSSSSSSSSSIVASSVSAAAGVVVAAQQKVGDLQAQLIAAVRNDEKESVIKLLEQYLHDAKEELKEAKAEADAAKAKTEADAAKAKAEADAAKAKAEADAAKAEAKADAAKADAAKAEDKYEKVKKEKGDKHADTLKAQLEWYRAQLEWFEAKKNVIRSNRALASLLGQEVESFDNDLVANDADQTAVRKQMSKHETQDSDTELSILTKGLKKLSLTQSGSKSGSSKSPLVIHPDMENVEELAVPLRKFDKDKLHRTCLVYAEGHDAEFLKTSGEAGVRNLVSYVCREAVLAHRLENSLELILENPFCAWRHDVDVLLRQSGIIKAIVEVKKGARLKSDVERQVFDYLSDVHSMQGVEHPIAIATCYQEWRFFWLPHSTNQLKHFADIANTTAKKRHEDVVDPRPDRTDDQPRTSSTANAATLKGTKIKRKLCTSRTYAWDDWELVPALLSFVQFASQSQVEYPTFRAGAKRAVTVFNAKGWHYRTMTFSDNFAFSWEMPPESVTAFLAIKPLGHGRDGKVFKVCDAHGRLAALKFCTPRAGWTAAQVRTAAEKEATRWQRIGFKRARCLRKDLRDSPAVLMPYVPHLRGVSNEDDEWFFKLSSDAHRAAIRNAITEFAAQGYLHNDLVDEDDYPKLWHIGVQETRDVNGVISVDRAVLLDLSDVTESQAPYDAGVAELKMLKRLKIPQPATQTSATAPSTPGATHSQMLKQVHGSPFDAAGKS